MIRINKNKLRNKNNKLCLEDEPFSGIVFFENNCEIKYKKIYANGLYVKDYISPLYSLPSLEINFDYLEGDDPYYPKFQFYQDKKFTGIAYAFNNSGFCTDEMFFLDGMDEPISSINYYISGKLKSYDSQNDNFSQIYTWQETGNLKDMMFVYYQNTYKIRFEISFSKNQSLKKLCIKNGYFRNISTFKKNAEFDIFEEKSFLNKYFSDENLSLLDIDVDDEIFYYLHLNEGLERTKALNIKDTSLTDESFKKLIGLKNLENT